MQNTMKANDKTESTLEQRLFNRGLPDGTPIFANYDYEKACIGYDDFSGRAIYDWNLMVESLMEDAGMSEEDAMEWIDFNTANAHFENGPIIMNRLEGVKITSE